MRGGRRITPEGRAADFSCCPNRAHVIGRIGKDGNGGAGETELRRIGGALFAERGKDGNGGTGETELRRIGRAIFSGKGK